MEKKKSQGVINLSKVNQKKGYQKRDREPNILQARLLNEVLSSEGKFTKADLIRKAGYGPSIAKNPNIVLKSKSFIRLLAKNGMTPDFVSKKHLKLMNSNNEMIGLKSVGLYYDIAGLKESAKVLVQNTQINNTSNNLGEMLKSIEASGQDEGVNKRVIWDQKDNNDDDDDIEDDSEA